MGKKNPLVFLDVSIDGDPAEKMVFKLFYDTAPKTAENFRALCTGEKGNSATVERPLHYKGSFFHRIVKGLIAQGGDFLKRDGSFGESIYGDKFPDEPISKLKHDERGLLTMAVADRDVRGSLFAITLKPFRQLDSKHVVFGKLVKGHEVLEKIDNAGDENGWPLVAVKIVNCGEFFKEKRGKAGASKPSIDEANCKGKRKKSSTHKRRRRKYYESDTTSDSETETSDSDSDTDSDSDSDSESSSLSSSSDDKRRKRKRSSKRDRYKRGKKSKRHDKKHRKRHRKSKRRPKRESDSLADTDSQSESSEAGDADINGKNQNHKPLPEMIAQNQQTIVEEPASVMPGKGTPTDTVEKEVEHLRRNGVRQSNGRNLEAKAGAASHRPDKFDDHRGKSRSQSVTPKRSLSKSMSISHEKSLSPRQSARSPSFNESSRLPSRRSRSISRTPASDIRSPVTVNKEKSISRSPMKDVKKNLSRSPVKFSLVGGRRGSGRPPPRKISKSPVGAFARRSYSRSPISDHGRSAVPERGRNGVSDRGRSPISDHGRSPVSDRGRILVSNRGRSPGSNRGRSPGSDRGRSPGSDRGRSPGSDRGRSPGSDRGGSLSKSPNDGSPQQRIRRGRGFSQRFSYARRYRTPSPDRSPVRSYRYGRNERYRRSPGYNRSPPRERIPLRKSPRRYRSPPTDRSPRRSPRRLRSPHREKSPVRYRSRKSRTRSPVSRSPSPYRAKRPSPPSRSRSPLAARSSPGLTSPKKVNNKNRSRSPSSSSSGSPLGNNRKSLVSYGDGSPDVN